jgi:outer membrane protein OmpA-like peptidoglycan-associated protein
LIDLIEGYNPDRKLNIYANGGVGLGVDRFGSMVQRFGKVYYEALCGLGVSYKMNKITLRIEDNLYLPGDFGNGFKFDKGYYNCLSVGLYYNFGITEVDKIRLAQMEEVLAKGEAYDEVVYDCTSTVNKYQDSLQRTYIGLVKAVVEYDSLCTRVEMLEKNTEEFEKLRAQLEQMREEQYTYWALPVSIQFDFDSYTVNTGELYKVKALAEVMSGGDYKYLVVGFADSIGSVEYNNELSMRRAEAVKDELVQRGVREEQIEVRAVGMDSPFGTLHKTNRKVSVYRVIE